MTCEQFESIARDLATDRPMAADRRAEAEAHLEGCARCQRRLAGERALTERLRRLATADADLEAPPAVEAALLAAFRAAGPAVSSPRVTVVPSPRRPRPRPGAWAAAAAIALALGAGAMMALREGGETPAPVAATPAPAPAPEPPAPEPVERTDGDLAIQPSSTPPDTEVDKKPRRHRAPRRAPAPVPDLPSNALATAERLTEFVPFGHGTTAGMPETGQVVRVQVPRTVLLSQGFPVNVERDEPVTADLLVAEDGTARAIRFVADMR